MSCTSQVSIPAPHVGSLLGFTGQPRDPLTGWYHLGNGHRTYNPVLMRFHSADRLSPFGKGGINAYAYCSGDPVNRHDPTGQFFQIAGLALRALGMMSNAVTLIYNFLGPVPTNRVGLNANRISTFGSVLSLASSAAQFAGVSSAVFGSNVGTAVSMTATLTRAAYAAMGPGSKPLQQAAKNWKLLTGGSPLKPRNQILGIATMSRTGRDAVPQPVQTIDLSPDDKWDVQITIANVRTRRPSK